MISSLPVLNREREEETECPREALATLLHHHIITSCTGHERVPQSDPPHSAQQEASMRSGGLFGEAVESKPPARRPPIALAAVRRSLKLPCVAVPRRTHQKSRPRSHMHNLQALIAGSSEILHLLTHLHLRSSLCLQNRRTFPPLKGARFPQASRGTTAHPMANKAQLTHPACTLTSGHGCLGSVLPSCLPGWSPPALPPAPFPPPPGPVEAGSGH